MTALHPLDTPERDTSGGRRGTRVLRQVKAVPFTAAFTVVFLAVAVATQSLWKPATEQPWYVDVAYGLPSFEAGRWWTIITGAFVAGSPLSYPSITIASVLVLAWCEKRRGTLITAAAFTGGHLLGAGGAALFLALVTRQTSWPWAERLAGDIDVGPSAGITLALVAAAASMTSPWRLRLQLAIVVALIIPVVFVGTLADVEHLIPGALGLALFFRGRPTRPGIREVRLIATAALLAAGITDVLLSIIPTNGPLGPSEFDAASWWDIATTVVVVALLVRGIRRGSHLAWILTCVVAGLNVFAGALELVLVLLRLPTLGLATGIGDAVLWLVTLLILITGRRSFRAPRRRRAAKSYATAGEQARTDAIAALHAHGGSSLSWMITWPDMEYVITPERSSVVGLQRHRGVAIALGDPVAPPGQLREVMEDFRARTEAVGDVPCFFSTSATARVAAPPGWRSLQIAEDTVIDLPDLTLTGKKWQPARGSMNRAEREGIAFKMVQLAHEPWAIRTQVRAISEAWVGEKALPEMRFTLGGVDEALDPDTRVAIALDPDGSVHGVLSWLPVYGPDNTITGWTLDLMRRRDGGFGPVIEFLITKSALYFKGEGASYLSLSGAPLAQRISEDPDIIQVVLERLGRLLEPAYGFRSLHAFKKKFNPRFEPLYLLYRDEADLPGISRALVRAFLPTASTLDLARVGLDTLNRRDLHAAPKQ